MGSKLIGARIQSDKARITEMYESGVAVAVIADEYEVKVDTLCRRLLSWGIEIKSGDWHKKEECKRFKQKFSSELMAKMKENTRINNDKKKGIQYVKFVRTTADQYLISNIINHPIIG